MNKSYLEFVFNIEDESLKDILVAELNSIGFSGFEEDENKLVAFIESTSFDEESFHEIIASHGNLSFTRRVIKEQNWNRQWEENFQPVVIEKVVAIRAHFHQPVRDVRHEIIITPKMSFGTGHHATTYLMLEQMSSIDFNGKTVLDFGTGTGILAIYAEKLGSASVTAIDNDEWSISNASENIQMNNCSHIQLQLADKPPANNIYQVVLANINKNIITDNFKCIAQSLDKNAVLLLSGLLAEDEAEIIHLSISYHLQHLATYNRNNWICMKFCN